MGPQWRTRQDLDQQKSLRLAQALQQGKQCYNSSIVYLVRHVNELAHSYILFSMIHF
jgi:hypothetical protein